MTKIFINSLPKAGTNLVAKILDEVGFEEHTFIGSNMILNKGVKASIKSILNLHFKQGYIVGIDSPVSASKKYIDYRLKKAPDCNTYVTAHVGYSDRILNTVLKLNYKPILVIRDPRDVLNSFVHYVQSNKNHPMYSVFRDKPYEFVFRSALYGYHDMISLESLVSRCYSLMCWINHPSVEVLRFEHIVGRENGGDSTDQMNVTKKISTFTGIETDIVWKVLTDRLSTSTRHTYRKGKVGSWRTEIPQEYHEELNRSLDGILKLWNY